jgi:hypothetical protein
VGASEKDDVELPDMLKDDMGEGVLDAVEGSVLRVLAVRLGRGEAEEEAEAESVAAELADTELAALAVLKALAEPNTDEVDESFADRVTVNGEENVAEENPDVLLVAKLVSVERGLGVKKSEGDPERVDSDELLEHDEKEAVDDSVPKLDITDETVA